MKTPLLLAAATASAALLGGCAQMGMGRGTATNPAHPGVALIGSLDGKGEVPGPGDPDGTGEFAGFFDVAGGKLCYDLGVGSLDKVTVQHIHAGAPRASGPPVVTLATPDGTHSEGCMDVDRALLGQILANPEGFYVNVHTTAYPQGAIRSQLQKP